MSTPTKVPDIPQAVATDPTQLQRFIDAVREILQVREGRRGNALEEGVTFRDLTEIGLAARNPGGGWVGIGGQPGAAGPAGPAGPAGTPYVPDYTAPPSPTGLAAVSLFRGALIEWDAPTYTVGHGNAYTEIYVAQYGGTGPLPTFAAAVAIGKVAGSGTATVHDAAMGAQLHIWAHHVTVDGTPSATPAGGTNGVQITVGHVGNSDLGPLIITADKLAAASVTNAKMAANAIGLPNFAAGIEPISIVTGSTVPTTKTTETIFLAGTSKLYRWSGSAYVSSVPSTDITGQLADAQIAALAASKVTGQLSDSQIAAVAAAKVTGQITSTQITDGAISTPKLSAGAVTTAVLAADAVTADKIAANAVTAAEIAAGAIVAGKIAAGAIAAGDIAAGAVTAGKIAANAVTANEIAANAVTAGKVAAGAIGADQILANAIVAGKIAAGAIAVGSAAIADGAIRNALIANAAIDAAKIADATIVAAKIVDGTITTAKIGDAQITNAKIVNIDASKITAGFIDAARIAAGSITSTMINSNGLTIRDSAGNLILDAGGLRNAAYGANLLYNGDFSADMDQWFFGANGAVTETAMGFNLSGFALIPIGARGNRALWSTQVGTVSAGDQAISYQWHSPPVVATGGERLVGSVYVGAHRCAVECFLFAYNSSDQLILVLPAGDNNRRESTEGGGGGGNLSNWKRIYTGDTAPAGTAYVRLVLRKYNTVNLQANSYMFATRCMVEKVALLAPIAPTPWAPPSDMSRITAANASTFIADLAVDTLQIKGNAITVPVGAALSADVPLTAGVGVAQTMLSVGSMDTGGAPLFVIATISGTVTTNAVSQGVTIAVKVGAAVVFSANLAAGASSTVPFSITRHIYVPSPGSGSNAISVTMTSNGGGGSLTAAVGLTIPGTSVFSMGTKK